MDYTNPTHSASPYSTGMLKLDDRHEMYFRQSGNPSGQAVVVLHGGPGAGINQIQSNMFNPLHYRIVEFDQRGAGGSTPRGELIDNTTQHLISDIEKLRDFLNISHWLVVGGSWGSTLAILYAQRFPNHVSGMILRGIFLGSNREISWYMHGMRTVFPEAWELFIAFLSDNERSNPLQAYKERLLNIHPDIHHPAALAWCQYEASCSTLLPASPQLPQEAKSTISKHQALTLARIQAHFFAADFFISDTEILENIQTIRAIPTVIIQGRYDMICPIASANKLHKAWPNAAYQIIPNAGHAATEPGTRRALIAAAKQFQQTIPTQSRGVQHARAT